VYVFARFSLSLQRNLKLCEEIKNQKNAETMTERKLLLPPAAVGVHRGSAAGGCASSH